MSKEATPQLMRALVDFYQGGRLLYAAGNLYPSDDRLQLLKARGEAEEYKQVKPAEQVKAQKTKPGQAATFTDSATVSDGAAEGEAAKAAAAGTAVVESEK